MDAMQNFMRRRSKLNQNDLLEKWENSECKDCPSGDKSLYMVSGKPCVEKQRIVLKGSFCAIDPRHCKPKTLIHGEVVGWEDHSKMNRFNATQEYLKTFGTEREGENKP